MIIERFRIEQIYSIITSEHFSLAKAKLFSPSDQKSLYILYRLYNCDKSINDIIDNAYRSHRSLANSLVTSYSRKVPNNSHSYVYADHIISEYRSYVSFSDNFIRSSTVSKEANYMAIKRSGNADFRNEFYDKPCMDDITLDISSTLLEVEESLSYMITSSYGAYYSSVDNFFKGCDKFISYDYKIDEIFHISEYFDSLKKLRKQYRGNFRIKVYPLGIITILNIRGKYFTLNDEIIRRVHDFINCYFKLHLVINSVQVYEPITFMKTMKNFIFNLAKKDPELVGEVMKASRNISVANLADDNIMGSPMKSLLIAQYEGIKGSEAERLFTIYEEYLPSVREIEQFSNIYKFAIHPDIDPEESFAKLEGLYEVNEVDNGKLKMFEGVLRRSIYESLVKSGYDPRLSDGPLTVDATSDKNYRMFISASVSSWSETRFARCRKLVPFDETEVTISDKSSAPDIELDYDSLTLLKSMRGYSPRVVTDEKLLSKLLTKNDASSALLGDCKLGAGYARERVSEIAKKHRDFLDTIGKEYDQVSRAEYEDFFRRDPSAFHFVMTEPKLGEKHKKLPRMFYMAQQEIKAYTQRVERLARQISRKQKGVSITKSMASRKRDILSFLNNMVVRDNEDIKPIYMSFDMTAFSMKFPMKLLDIYSNILYELTSDPIYLNLSLIFRSAVVLHTTRTHFDFKISPRGGFEGFLNFVWTSIHIAILETALITTGCPGEALTYSDDAILKMIYKDLPNGKTTAEVVYTVQNTYLELGMEFNIGKTTVSSNIWEYLGMICHKGVLLSNWVKEISSVYEFDPSRGFTPLALKINMLSAQCAALSASGCKVSISSYLLHLYALRILSKRFITVPISILKYLLILPNSIGGFRVLSPIELSCRGGYTVFSELICDLDLMTQDDSFPSYIIQAINENMSTSESLYSLALTSSWIKFKKLDTSGRMSMIYLFESAVNVSSIPMVENPIDDSLKEDINLELSSIGNIDLTLLGDLLISVPSVKEYERSIALMRSSAVFRLVPKKRIIQAQKMDTKRCLKAVDFWSNVHRTYSQNQNPFSILDKFRDSYPNVAIPLPSIRHLYDPNGSNVTISTTFLPAINWRGEVTDYMGDVDFKEDLEIVAYRETELLYSSEAYGTGLDHDIKRYINKIVALITTEPSIAPVLANISYMFGINLDLSTAYNKVMRSPYRGKAYNLSSMPIITYSPNGQKELTGHHILPAYLSAAEVLVHKDLSTVPSLALAMHLNSLSFRNLPFDTNIVTVFKIPTYMVSMFLKRPVMYAKDYVRVKDIPRMKNVVSNYMENEMMASIDDILEEANITEHIAEYHHLSPASRSNVGSYIYQFIIKLVKEHVKRLYNTNTRNLLNPTPALPTDFYIRKSLIEEVVYDLTFDLFPIHQILSILKKLSDNPHEDMMATKDDSLMNIIDNFKNFYNILSKEYMSVMTEESCNEFLTFDKFTINAKRYVASLDLLNFDSTMILFINDGTKSKTASSEISNTVHQLYRKQLDILTNKLIHSKWDINMFPDDLRNNFGDDVDEMYDIITVIVKLLRSSSHREADEMPFNFTMAKVVVVQIWAISSYIIDNYNLKGKPKQYISNKINEILGYTSDSDNIYMPDYESDEDSYDVPTAEFDHSFIYSSYIKRLDLFRKTLGPDHKIRLNSRISYFVRKRIVDRVNLGILPPMFNTYYSCIEYIISKITFCNQVFSQFLANKITIKYSSASLSRLMKESGGKAIPTFYNIPDTVYERSPIRRIQLDQLTKYEKVTSEVVFHFTYCRAVESKDIPPLELVYLPPWIKTNIPDNFTSKGIKLLDYQDEPGTYNLQIFSDKNFRRILYHYKRLLETTQGVVKIYKFDDDYYLISISSSILQRYRYDTKTEFHTAVRMYDETSKELDYAEEYKEDLSIGELEALFISNVRTDQCDFIDTSGPTSLRKRDQENVLLNRSKFVKVVPYVNHALPVLALATEFARFNYKQGALSQIFAYVLLCMDAEHRLSENMFNIGFNDFKDLFSDGLIEVIRALDNKKTCGKVRIDISICCDWLLKNPIECISEDKNRMLRWLKMYEVVNIKTVSANIAMIGNGLTVGAYLSLSKAERRPQDLYSVLHSKPLDKSDQDAIRSYLHRLEDSKSNLLTLKEEEAKDTEDNPVSDYANLAFIPDDDYAPLTFDYKKDDDHTPDRMEELFLALKNKKIMIKDVSKDDINELDDWGYSDSCKFRSEYSQVMDELADEYCAILNSINNEVNEDNERKSSKDYDTNDDDENNNY